MFKGMFSTVTASFTEVSQVTPIYAKRLYRYLTTCGDYTIVADLVAKNYIAKFSSVRSNSFNDAFFL